MDSRTLKLQCKGWYISQNVNIIHISMFKTLPYGSVFLY